jgi:uncharacterized protein (TIGR01777 family)
MDRTVAVTGASGFVGKAVVHMLRSRGARVIALSRTPGSPVAAGIENRFFDPNAEPNPSALAGADAVIHLAGESVAGRWTAEKKRRIADSRIAGTRTLVASLARAERRPSVLVSASAVGYYGDRNDEPLTESSAPGSGFLADVCAGWEAAAREAEALGIRTVRMRTGIALGDGGALAQMKLPFALFVGGPLGSGRQFVPWIHVSDLAALYCLAIEETALAGALNAVTPDYATNARLSQAIGSALRRPSLLPAPPFALRAALGEFAASLLVSQLVIPAVAQDARFQWQHPQLESALAALLGSSAERPAVRTFHTAQFVGRPLAEIFDFFADARNLEAITPAALSFTIRAAPAALQRGSIVEYDLRLHGFPVHWKTMIAEYEPMHRFVDVQLRGPYRLWRHAHEFEPVDGGVQIGDRVDYLLPGAPFGELAAPLVARDVAEIFRFRREAISERFR